MKPLSNSTSLAERIDLAALRATAAAEPVERELGLLWLEEFTRGLKYDPTKRGTFARKLGLAVLAEPSRT